MANPVTWFEIMGKDSAGLQRFYRELFGWKMTPPVAEMGNYSMLEDHEPGMGGGIGAGDARVSVYVEVDDPQAFLDRAALSGATVLMPVTEIVPGTIVAMLLDPGGNTFGLMKANRPAKTTRKKTTARKSTARKATGARKKTTAHKKTTARRTRRRR